MLTKSHRRKTKAFVVESTNYFLLKHFLDPLTGFAAIAFDPNFPDQDSSRLQKKIATKHIFLFPVDLPDDKAWGKNRNKYYGADVDDGIGKVYIVKNNSRNVINHL